MAEQFTIVDEQVGAEALSEYRLRIDAELDDFNEKAGDKSATGRLDILIMKRTTDEVIVHIRLSAEVSNPLFVTTAILVAAGKYAGCVAAAMVGSTATLMHQSHDESKETAPKMALGERLRDGFKRLGSRKAQLKQNAAGALAGCAVSVFL